MLADSVPIYPLYALLFVDSGLSDLQISLLFAIWSAVGVLVEVPSGVVADRFSRRGCLVAGDIIRAVGFAAWVLLPEFAGFAAGFVLWGIGSSLVSGAQEALLYDGLVAAGAREHYAAVNGRVSAAELTSQLPAAAAGTALFSLGGYQLAGWVSVGVALLAALLASRIPEAPRTDEDDDEGEELGYLATLKVGLSEAAARDGARAVLVAVMAVAAFDSVEEYFPLALASWGVPVAWVPVVDLPIVLAGVLGASAAGLVNRLGAGALGALLAVAMLLFGAAGLLAQPVVGVAATAAFYGIYRAVVVVCDARLQDRIASHSRATVTSVAGLGTDVVSFAIYAAWVVGEVPALAALGLLVAAALPRLLRSRPGAPTPGPGSAARR
ncbi:MFS transporter [Pseudonocardia lacus]|uniref:MFS transporter n=1 Tax=Pseudonocardia lacus TaxID=2835865 RepID=UPI0027E3463D|nr:MFS transporter [Pseudonocardia lacus]